MRVEQKYEFRKNYCRPHKRILNYKNQLKSTDEIALENGLKIYANCDGIVAKTALKDFVSYFKIAFGFSAKLTDCESEAIIRVYLAPDKISGYMARKTEISSDGVVITAADERGIAQGLYSLEDRMNLRKSPFLKIGTSEEKPLFSPRMIHSGYDMDVFPDEYISTCAHYGYDTLMIYVRSEKDYPAIADLVKRAAPYGLDVYAYSAFKNFVHPEAEGAKEIYSRAYGDVFRKAPGLKGMVFVGESVEFPSKDPNVIPYEMGHEPADALFEGKHTPGWWPCMDYPQWISLVRDSIREVEPDADIVFWTYNWGRRPKEARIKLIESLPTDISLQVTFEMFEQFNIGNSKSVVADYTISFPGPGQYFLSEAEAAKKRGIKLYAMTNTAGRAWDFGVVPYFPFPSLWHERNSKLVEFHERYGLCGIMETHHYGFTPSFISKLATGTFTEGTKPFEARLMEYARVFSEDEYQLVLDALQDLDESHRYYVPSNENQYGPYRIGPAYPFCIDLSIKKPDTTGPVHGNRIYFTYTSFDCSSLLNSPYSMRIHDELKRHKTALKLTKSALAKLKKIKNKNTELKKLINMVEFMMRCHITAINFKEFCILRDSMKATSNEEKIHSLIGRMEKIIHREIDNVIATIPLVQKDSALGYEPSMDYQCDAECLEWKLRQMDYILRVELPRYMR